MDGRKGLFTSRRNLRNEAARASSLSKSKACMDGLFMISTGKVITRTG
jgi:hypothetical protein